MPGHLDRVRAAARRYPWAVLVCALGLASLGAAWLIRGYVLPRQYVGAAQEAIRQHDLLAAREQLNKCLNLRPGSGPALFLAAQTARRLGDAASAERLLTDWEDAQGSTEESRREWLLLGVQQGDFAGQERELRATVEQGHPDSVMILEALARGYGAQLRWNVRGRCLELILQREPQNTLAVLLQGETALMLSQPERALADFERAVRMAPKDAGAHRALAEVLCRLGETRRAAYHYELARRLQPDDPAVLLGSARCCFDLAELDRSQELLDQLLANDSEHVEGLVDRGRSALRRGQTAQAEGLFARAVRAAPWHRAAQRHLCLCLEELGKSSAAEACREELRRLDAEDGRIGRLTQRVKDAPNDPDVCCEVGRSLLRGGKTQLGRGWLMMALAVAPRHRPTNAALADEFAKEGQPRRAAHHRRLAEESAP